MARRTKAVESLPGAADETAGTVAGAENAAAKPAATPVANLILADLVLRGGSALLRRVVEQNLLGRSLEPDKGKGKGKGKGKPAKLVKGRSIGQTLLGTAAMRIATRSVPGAILVGGGLLAKALHDRKKARKAAGKE